MTISKFGILLFFVLSLFVTACNNDSSAILPTLAPTTTINQPSVADDMNLPPTNTPVVPPELSDDLDAIDAVLQDIDNDICREAHEAWTEIKEMLAQGQDVADLEVAIVELINELDNCSLEITPTP